jgi:glycosyltransferase involved in cell wall biosynthesis
MPWHGGDLTVLQGVLGPHLEQHGLAFLHAGHIDDPAFPTASEELRLKPSVRCLTASQTPFGPDEGAAYRRLWHPIDIAIAPLADTEFNRAKSWLKPLEAAAFGLPFVASDVPAYRELGFGRLARRPDQWRRHFEELLDPAVRKAEGQSNRVRAEEFAISRQWTHWESALEDVRRSDEL